MGPDFVPPKPAMPASFTEQTSAAKASQTSDDAWWKSFGDATLDSLMADALQSAPDLAVAQARIREARALRGIAGAEQYPTVDVGAQYDRTHGASIYRIGALIGQPPEQLLAQLDAPQAIPLAVAEVPVGLPSDLLRRRPDIRVAEHRIAAANARIGVAQADLYPHFSLTGAAGLESLNASTFLTAPSRYFSIGPNISWLIFGAGKVRIPNARRRGADRSAMTFRRHYSDVGRRAGNDRL
ncbi:TolC family protein [Paraburkholderia sp. SIMBA_030]|uniref:TolC family protein n=1 Tax=Paraburkholderia sp. SIMBA_030 TaxID=3085773 RepID=UPI00397B8643